MKDRMSDRKEVRLNIWLTKRQNYLLDVLARETGRTKSGLVREAISKLISEYKWVIITMERKENDGRRSM